MESASLGDLASALMSQGEVTEALECYRVGIRPWGSKAVGFRV
jgi:hypothetical protein